MFFALVLCPNHGISAALETIDKTIPLTRLQCERHGGMSTTWWPIRAEELGDIQEAVDALMEAKP